MRLLLGWGRRCGGGSIDRRRTAFSICAIRVERSGSDISHETLRDIYSATAAGLQAPVKAAIPYGSTRYRCGSHSDLRAEAFNCADDVILGHARIRDYCPLTVKGLLSPSVTIPSARTKAP